MKWNLGSVYVGGVVGKKKKVTHVQALIERS